MRVIASRDTLAALFAVLLMGGCASTRRAPLTAPVSAAACFPIETLPDPDRVFADHILLEISDREGLYTLADGLKSVSSDVRDLQLRIEPTLDSVRLNELDRLRKVTAMMQCGEVGVFVQVFTATYPARDSSISRSASLVVYHRSALRALILRQASFFGRLGVTPFAEPWDVVSAVENAPRADRWRGYGYLFGYPDEAVDFFVRAGVEGDSTKTLVPRDFRRVETYRKFPETRDGPPVNSTFVYAVPKGAAESTGDRALTEASIPRFRRYREMRQTHIAADSTGAVALWRAWYAREAAK